MSFNHLQPPDGPFILGPDGSMRVWVRFGNPGEDQGAQWIMADPIGLGSLTVDGFTKEKRIIGPHGRTDVRYWATVTNNDPVPVLFTLTGGGNT